jgi:HPt (histidine-containing phosphotransfer) domain-containing protein
LPRKDSDRPKAPAQVVGTGDEIVTIGARRLRDAVVEVAQHHRRSPALLQRFSITAAETEREIAAAVGSGDLAAAAAAAHKLNGAARTVGAMAVAEAAALIEQAGKAGDRTGCSEALGPLAGELRRVRAAM